MTVKKKKDISADPLSQTGFLLKGQTSAEKKPGGFLFKGQEGGQIFRQSAPPPKSVVPKKDTTKERTDIAGNIYSSTMTEADRNKAAGITGVPMTIDSEPDSKGGLQSPDFLSGLPRGEESARQEELDAQVRALQDESAREIMEIRKAGKSRLGAAKGFLAKIGALGRTVSGAPVETNLGVLSFQNQLIEKAVREEQQNLAEAISSAKAGSRKAAEERIEALNELRQVNFDNALKLLQDDRAIDEEDRKNMLADLEVDKLNFEIKKANNDLSKENMGEALSQITRMAESGIVLDQLSVETINSLETSANLPSGTFEAFFESTQDAANLATEENIAKVDKIKADILNQIERTKIAQQQANTSAYSASTSAARLAFDKQKHAEEQGGKDVKMSYDDFAKGYGEQNQMSISGDSSEIKEAYGNYEAAFEAEKRLQEIYDDPTSSYKDYQLAGGEAGTGKNYEKWLEEMKNKDLQILERILGK